MHSNGIKLPTKFLNVDLVLSDGFRLNIGKFRNGECKDMTGWELVTAAGRLIAMKPQTINEQIKNGSVNVTIGRECDYPNSRHLPELRFA